MLKKSIPVIFIIAAVCLLFLAAHAITYQETETPIPIEQLKTQIINAINQNKTDDLKTGYETLIKDYNNTEEIVPAIYEIAELLRAKSQFRASLAAYKYIVDNHPSNSQSILAQRGYVIANIAVGNMKTAVTELEKLKTEYTNDPNIAQMIFNVGDAYYWFSRYSDANSVYEYVIQNYPKSEFAMWATMGLAISSIASEHKGGPIYPNPGFRTIPVIENVDKLSAQGYINKLSLDFADANRLPEALFYIAGRYGYDKRFDNAVQIYNFIAQNYPQTNWAKNSLYESAKLPVLKYINLKDEPNAILAMDKLIADFKDRNDLPLVVLDMGWRWEIRQRPTDANYHAAEAIYNKVIEKWRQRPQASNAKMQLIRMEISRLIKAKQIEDANSKIEQLIADFNDNPQLPAVLDRLLERGGAKEWSMRLNKLMEDKYGTNTSTNRPKLLYDLAKGYGNDGNTSEEIKYYKILLEQYPDSEYSNLVPYHLGMIYAKMGDYEQALNWMDQQSILYPNNKSTSLEPKTGKAMIYYTYMKDYSKAAEVFEEIIKENPNNFNTPYFAINLATCYEKTGEKQKAIELLNDIIKNFSSSAMFMEDVKRTLKQIEEGKNNAK